MFLRVVIFYGQRNAGDQLVEYINITNYISTILSYQVNEKKHMYFSSINSKIIDSVTQNFYQTISDDQ